MVIAFGGENQVAIRPKPMEIAQQVGGRIIEIRLQGFLIRRPVKELRRVDDGFAADPGDF
jgi:hypothetical protein